MKKKKLFPLILTGVLSASLVLCSGCGGSGQETPPAQTSTGTASASSKSTAASSFEIAKAEQDTTQTSSASSKQGGTAAPAQTTQAPTPTPEEVLPDGTIHTPLTEAGSIYISENRGFSPYYFAPESGDAYAAMLNTVAGHLGSEIRTFSILPPTSFAVCLGQEVQDEMYCSDETAAIESVYAQTGAGVIPVRTMDTLKKHNAEYLFFATDHHWTVLGAYYAYREWCAAAGITPHELSEFQKVSYPDFLGLFYIYSDYAEALAANPDTVDAYIPMGTNAMVVSSPELGDYAYNIISDVSADDAGTKYSAFLGGDSALYTIENPAITDGSACILIKDSFGNAFAPFLVDHYQTVYVVDYRYYTGDLTTFAKEHGVKDVLILTNVDEILQSTSETIQDLFP